MYSPYNDIQTPSFDGAEGLCNNLELSNGMDYMRRFSYADLLSNNSESSLSDYEQQTPSPSNDYEDYIFQQHHHHQYQHLHPQQHPLEEQKRRMSMIEQATYYQQQQPSSYMLPTDYLQPNTNNTNGSILPPSSLGYTSAVNAMNHSHFQQQQQRSMSYSAGDVMSTLVPSMFDYQANCTSSPMGLNGRSTEMMPLVDSSSSPSGGVNTSGLMPRDRLDSLSSLSSSSSSSMSPPSSQAQTQVKLTKSGKVKQCRSRGRRVSSNPTIGSKMFTCKHDDCGKVFKRSEHLKRHVRSIHTLEKPFECPYQSCSKRFSRSDNLNQHIRIHRHTSKEKLANSANNSSNLSPSASSNTSSSSSPSSSFSNCMPSYM